MHGGKTERLEGQAGLPRAVELLRGGGTVAFPTETVYGLGANALEAEAVAKIFAAKERPGWDPLIVHVSDREMLARVAVIPEGLQGRVVRELMETFWPGPLTLLLPRTESVPDAVTAGRSLVGVRMPGHPLALELIRQAGVPLAAPSANRFGRTSPTTAAHVLEDLGGRIDAVLDGGPTAVGVESTVIGPDPDDLHGFVLYRPGGVTLEMLESVCGAGMIAPFVSEAAAGKAPESLPSPGVGMRHYAPRARLVLVSGLSKRVGPLEAGLVAAIDDVSGAEGVVGVMLPEGWDASCAAAVYRWGDWGDAETLARRLFAGLRELDEAGATVIVCPVPEMGGLGEAIRDRLEKAARKK
jgi:L-threonylcarbamoyladenylate synthase